LDILPIAVTGRSLSIYIETTKKVCIMEETKSCPYCGAEINAKAKKCRVCGKWIEKQCPYCGEWIVATAKKCRHCGSWLSEYARYAYEKENGISTQSSGATSKEAISKGIQDAMAAQTEVEEDRKDAKNASCLLWVEDTILFVCILVLYGWAVAIVVSIITSILLLFQTVRILYCILLSLVWGIVAFSIGGWIWGILLFVGSLAWHAPAFKSSYEEYK
jgi:predicted RNA-binding Zn-ribbon protein involved in translation (DUF1610 family)